MEDILREQAGILRSMADELDAVADAMTRPPTVVPVVVPPTPVAPMEPEGTTSTVYTVGTNVNMGTIYQWADNDLKKGYKVYFKDSLTGLAEEYHGQEG